MLPSLNYDSKDPKYILLSEIFNIIDSKKARNILSRNGVNNRQMMVYSIKILFMAMYFDYDVSNVINELNRTSKLRKKMLVLMAKFRRLNRFMNILADILLNSGAIS